MGRLGRPRLRRGPRRMTATGLRRSRRGVTTAGDPLSQGDGDNAPSSTRSQGWGRKDERLTEMPIGFFRARSVPTRKRIAFFSPSSRRGVARGDGNEEKGDQAVRRARSKEVTTTDLPLRIGADGRRYPTSSDRLEVKKVTDLCEVEAFFELQEGTALRHLPGIADRFQALSSREP